VPCFVVIVSTAFLVAEMRLVLHLVWIDVSMRCQIPHG
jgi:hypothetical protein